MGVAVWLSRHVQVQVRYKGRQRRQETHDRQTEANPEEQFVPANLVERQTPDGISRGEQNTRINERSMSHDQNENETEGHRMSSHVNVAYLRSNRLLNDRLQVWHGSSAALLEERDVPSQQNVPMNNNNHHHGYDNDSYDGEQEVPTQQNQLAYDNDSDSYESVE